MRLMPHGRAHDLFFLCNELCGVNHLRRSRTFNRDDFVFFSFIPSQFIRSYEYQNNLRYVRCSCPFAHTKWTINTLFSLFFC